MLEAYSISMFSLFLVLPPLESSNSACQKYVVTRQTWEEHEESNITYTLYQIFQNKNT